MEDGRPGIYLVCKDCGVGKGLPYKSPPYRERCKRCNTAQARGPLGQLTIPEHERLKQGR